MSTLKELGIEYFGVVVTNPQGTKEFNSCIIAVSRDRKGKPFKALGLELHENTNGYTQLLKAVPIRRSLYRTEDLFSQELEIAPRNKHLKRRVENLIQNLSLTESSLNNEWNG